MIVYSKYNRGRKPEYQIVTFIEEDGQGKYIYKTALTPTARKHITAMFHNYEILSLLYGKAHVAKVERIDEDSLRFEYIEGVPWGRRIMERTANKGRKAFFSEMEKYYSFLQKEDIGRKACAFVDFSKKSLPRKLQVKKSWFPPSFFIVKCFPIMQPIYLSKRRAFVLSTWIAPNKRSNFNNLKENRKL